MRPFGIFIKIAFAAFTVLIAYSCGNREAGRLMNSAEDLMWTRPDSALATLETIDTLSLRTKAQRARFSLLFTMALNRNWIDTTDLHLILPAVSYYKDNGSNDDKMMTFYYLGTVQHNAGNPEDAIASYVRALEYSSESDNLIFKGLITSAISDLYCQEQNYSASLSYAEKALTLFKTAKDSTRMWVTTAMMASILGSMHKYEKSDSLYSEFFSSPCRDSSLYARMLLNKAIGNLWKSNPEPDLSIDLFRKSVNEFNGTPTTNDYCAYAYALELSGNSSAADNIISQLEAQGCQLEEIDVWCYRICRHRGEYKEALNLLERSVRKRDSTIYKAIDQSVALAQSAYYQSKSHLLIREKQLRDQRQWILILSGVIILSGLLSFFTLKRKEWRRKVEDLTTLTVCYPKSGRPRKIFA